MKSSNRKNIARSVKSPSNSNLCNSLAPIFRFVSLDQIKNIVVDTKKNEIIVLKYCVSGVDKKSRFNIKEVIKKPKI